MKVLAYSLVYYFIQKAFYLAGVKIKRIFICNDPQLAGQSVSLKQRQVENAFVAYSIVEFQAFERPGGNPFIHILGGQGGGVQIARRQTETPGHP